MDDNQRSQRNRRSAKEKRKKNRWMRKYFLIVFSMVGIFLIGFLCVAFVMGMDKKKPMIKDVEQGMETGKQETQKPEEEETPAGEKIIVAVFGLDKEELHTDVVFVVCFDTETKDLSLLQVPRDTKVVMTDAMIQNLEDRKKFVPTREGTEGLCKLTEVHAYAGPEYANEFSVLQLEDLLGIDIDYYVTVNIQGFRDIVDAIGGVEMEIEEDLDYEDPIQDLYIHLNAGYQTLDGDKAEQLVRFREGYAQRDLKRIQVQQDFMRAFMKKIMSTETLLKNLPNLVYTAFKYIETDISVGDALGYVKYVKDLSMDRVEMETIPGEGGSYFVHDPDGTKELVDKLFYGQQEDPKDTSEKTVSDSRKLSIEVANGGETQGLAAKTRTFLEDKGYTVAAISTFSGERIEETRIVVKEKGVGEDLIPLFPDSYIVVDSTMLSNGTDIKVILGLNAK